MVEDAAAEVGGAVLDGEPFDGSLRPTIDREGPRLAVAVHRQNPRSWPVYRQVLFLGIVLDSEEATSFGVELYLPAESRGEPYGVALPVGVGRVYGLLERALLGIAPPRARVVG